eukprot:CAMPEP_0170479532 /NCGR_PEP_ID=MMETSP0208-20121228/737_1 /TAXON_ID=197538 /ORGANISM="Strombidium inclinatum, Strain S3" /LENGTH=73 /DNA_ID=CAMNT_0010751949 /DNA_START=916 /DNA_END=1137 /DNA_ORIENTATION=+
MTLAELAPFLLSLEVSFLSMETVDVSFMLWRVLGNLDSLPEAAYLDMEDDPPSFYKVLIVDFTTLLRAIVVVA